MSFDPGFAHAFDLVALASVASPVDLLLTAADLTRTSDTDWALGSIWFDPDAEDGGLPTASVFGPAALGGTWLELFTGPPHITITPPDGTGGLLLVTAVCQVTAVTGSLKLRVWSDAPGWLPIEVTLTTPQVVTLVGNGRVEPTTLPEVWVQYQGVGTVAAGAFAPLFLPAGVRPSQQGDPWGRYWDGDAWQPPILAGAGMALGSAHIWDGGDPVTTPISRTLDGGDPATTPTTRTIDGGTP